MNKQKILVNNDKHTYNDTMINTCSTGTPHSWCAGDGL